MEGEFDEKAPKEKFKPYQFLALPILREYLDHEFEKCKTVPFGYVPPLVV